MLIPEELIEFLNLTSEQLSNTPLELLEKLTKAVNQDDWMQVHQLAYLVERR